MMTVDHHIGTKSMNEEDARERAWRNPSGTPESMNRFFGAPGRGDNGSVSHDDHDMGDDEEDEGQDEGDEEYGDSEIDEESALELIKTMRANVEKLTACRSTYTKPSSSPVHDVGTVKAEHPPATSPADVNFKETLDPPASVKTGGKSQPPQEHYSRSTWLTLLAVIVILSIAGAVAICLSQQ